MKRHESVYFFIGLTLIALFVAFAWGSDEILTTLAQSPMPTPTWTPTPTDTPVPPTPTDTPVPPTPTPADTKPPVSRVRRLRRLRFTPSFAVRWWGYDRGGSGIACYDVQTKDGTGSWQDWQACTTATSARFQGERGHLYFFRARATDSAGNVEAWPSRPDAWTYVRRWKEVRRGIARECVIVPIGIISGCRATSIEPGSGELGGENNRKIL